MSNENEIAEMLKKVVDSVGALCKRMDALESGAKDRKADEQAAREPSKAVQIAADSAAYLHNELQQQNKIRTDLRRREVALTRHMEEARPLTRDEEYQLVDIQARADAIFHGLGRGKVSPPFPVERPRTYTIRILNDLKRYSPTWKDITSYDDLDAQTLAYAEEQIFADAQAEVENPKDLPPTGFITRTTQSGGGHKVTNFFGRRSFVADMMPPNRVVRLLDPKESELRKLLARTQI